MSKSKIEEKLNEAKGHLANGGKLNPAFAQGKALVCLIDAFEISQGIEAPKAKKGKKDKDAETPEVSDGEAANPLG